MSERLRVLIADNNPAMLDVVKQILQKDFEVVAALNHGSDIMSQVPELKPDVVILDVFLGDTNGFEIARQLHLEHCPSKIVFLTVHEELDFIRAAFDVGASGYIFKSRLITDLRTGINTVLAGKVFLPQAPIP